LELQDIISSGLLELYAAGLASSEEMVQVENWVKQYPEVAAELNAVQAGIESYARANAIAPRNEVKEKIFAAINTTTPVKSIVPEIKGVAPAKVIPFKNYWKWAAAACIVLLAGSAAMNIMYFSKYNTASKDLKQTQQQLALEQQRSNDMKTDMDVVHNPYSMPVALKGMEAMPDATAKIFWMQDTKEVMVDASSLPDAPQGMQYQFWAIVDSKPVDGGLIITDDKGKKFRMQKMKSFGRAEAFAISLERKGGNPMPTKVVSMGKII
jgi:anti-sigma-K factor RskA